MNAFTLIPSALAALFSSTFSLFPLLAVLPAVFADVPPNRDLTSYQAGHLGDIPSQTFVSSPLKAPLYQINKLDVAKVDASRFIFITGGYDGYGPSIVSSTDLSLIWADQDYVIAQATRPGILHGEPVLTVFANDAVRIFNQSYDLLYAITPQGSLKGERPDSHEALLTEDGTVVMVISRREEADLTTMGRDGVDWVTNNHIQEVDPTNNAVLFQFDLRSYFHVEDSFWPWQGEGPYAFSWAHDLWHVNSVEKTEEGDFLVSSRHLHSIFLIDGVSGKVKWVIGGKRGQFKDVTVNGSAVFHWQHNARFTAANRITLFDNHKIFNGFCKQGEEICSRGLEIEFDVASLTYWVVNEWFHPQGIISASRGGVNRTPKGNTLVAWGQNPMYTEYSPDGELVMDVQRGQVLALDHGIGPVIAYRAWKGDWVGMPSWPPSIAATTTEDGIGIYVSWNGATEVESYVLFTSDDISALNGNGSITYVSSRTGFETSFHLREERRFARIAALDRNGAILGYTMVVDTATNITLDPGYPIATFTTSEEEADEDEEEDKVNRFVMVGPPTIMFAVVLAVVGITAFLTFMITCSSRTGVRWGHVTMRKCKKSAINLATYLSRTDKGTNGLADVACAYHDERDEEEFLIGDQGKRE
ncbi:ASST-domain-containing protein [Nemania diffusa]|nr:ASST-domain-containing protein [Nemania diffusa]